MVNGSKGNFENALNFGYFKNNDIILSDIDKRTLLQAFFKNIDPPFNLEILKVYNVYLSKAIF